MPDIVNGWLDSVKRHAPALTAMLVLVWMFIGYIGSRDTLDAEVRTRTMTVLEQNAATMMTALVENTKMLGRIERVLDSVERGSP